MNTKFCYFKPPIFRHNGGNPEIFDDFAKVNRKGFSSKNHVQNDAGKSSTVVDLIGNKQENYCEINGGISFVPSLLNEADKGVEFIKTGGGEDREIDIDKFWSNPSCFVSCAFNASNVMP